MTILAPKAKPPWYLLANESDVSSGSLTTLLGYPATTLGYTSGPFQSYPQGTRLLVRGSGRLYCVSIDNLGNKVAVLEETGLVSLPGVLFVDAASPPGGNGSLTLPFDNVQDALNAASAGTMIFVAPGTYVQDLSMPNTDNVTIMGSGRGSTILRNQTDNHTFQWVRALGAPAIEGFEMQDLTIENDAVTATMRAIHFDASADTITTVANQFLTIGANFERVDIVRAGPDAGEASYFARCGYIFLRACRWYGQFNANATLNGVAGTTTVINCSKFELHDGSLLTNWDLTYNRQLYQNFGGRDQYLLSEGSSVAPIQTNNPLNQGGVILRNHPTFVVDQTSAVYGGTRAGGATIYAIEGQGLTTIPAGAWGPPASPIITCRGIIGAALAGSGSGKVLLPLPAGIASSVSIVDFTRAQFLAISGLGTAVVTITAGTGAIPIPVYMRQCLFDIVQTTVLTPLANSVRLGSAVAPDSGTVVADICESCFNQTIFQLSGTSVLDRTRWLVTQNINNAPAVVSVGPPYPANNYTVLAETATAVATGISAKLPNQFTAVNTSAGLVATRFILVRS